MVVSGSAGRDLPRKNLATTIARLFLGELRASMSDNTNCRRGWERNFRAQGLNRWYLSTLISAGGKISTAIERHEGWQAGYFSTDGTFASKAPS
jgi:hypothetical protein